MGSKYFQHGIASSSVDRFDASSTPLSATTANAPRSNALSNKLTSILSASYTDFEIRDGLETLDKREIKNTPDTRRRLRLDVQKEVIECNGDIIKDFGAVAEVRLLLWGHYQSDGQRSNLSASVQSLPVSTDAVKICAGTSRLRIKRRLLCCKKLPRSCPRSRKWRQGNSYSTHFKSTSSSRTKISRS